MHDSTRRGAAPSTRPPLSSAGATGAGVPDAGESEHERLNRNLDQLLQELRVALPGVQVLFAFLLAVPFATRWNTVTPLERRVYFVTLLLAAAATALLIAPSMQHRLLFHQEDKRHLVAVANSLTIAGLTCLCLSINCALLLVADVLFGRTVAIATFVISVLLYAALWYVWPLSRRLRNQHSNRDLRA